MYVCNYMYVCLLCVCVCLTTAIARKCNHTNRLSMLKTPNYTSRQIIKTKHQAHEH